MAAEQLSIWGGQTGGDIRSDLETLGYAWVDHGIDPELVDNLISRYADFTDQLPDPSLETVNAMIPVGFDPKILEKQLDDLIHENDQAPTWHKYRTNYPAFAKPGGYTNRTLQVQALKQVRGVTLKDDPKEFYHFHPNSTVEMHRFNEQQGRNYWPDEATYLRDQLHVPFAKIHNLGAAAVKRAYQALEEDHPELVPDHFGPADVQASPVRLLFYHPDQGKKLAAKHQDKAMSTLQITESHLGLWIKDPKTGLIVRSADRGAFFPGKMFSDEDIGVFPDSPYRPAWHGVIKQDTLTEKRQLHGKNVSRWAIIFFANSIAAGTVLDKSLTHDQSADSDEAEAVA